VVKVRVVEVDVKRKRIGLSMRKDGAAAAQRSGTGNAADGKGRFSGGGRSFGGGNSRAPERAAPQGALAAALAEAMRRK